MMKKSGFKPHVAGAIEVVSSEGAQLVPPIMGAGAFLMAEITGIPYSTIALSAIIPSVLYYVSVFIVVDVESVKLGMRGLREVEKTKSVLWQGFLYLVPLALLFYLLLVERLSPTYAGMIAVLFCVGINQLQRGTRLTLRQIYALFARGTRMSAEITALIGIIGIVQQAFTITGMGARLSEILITVSAGQPTMVLIMAMVISIILGMGLPTPIAYILSAIFVAPALVEVGFPELGAHLFLFFFAIKSGSTPPIAVVAVVASGIARANWWKTAWLSFVYSLPGFFIAFAFIFHASYLLAGSWIDILVSCACGLMGVAGMSYSLQRYLLSRLGLAEVLILAGGSLVLLFSRTPLLFLGLACLLSVFSYQFMKFRKAPIPRESSADLGG